MSDTVIQVDSLWKKYRLGEMGTGTLRHDLNRWWHRVRGRPDPYAIVGQVQKSEVRSRKLEPTSDLCPLTSEVPLGDDEMWALRGVSFEVKQGEILGIIGRNGAGKSTLLKILSRVTAPFAGEVRVKGRIASLLEVGTGFHPELTGRENIFLNGTILGMSKRGIEKKLDEIVAFAEVEQFIDTPVKRYSSGMYVRLAFAVAAHLEPQILIMDEVLAVGDAQFQKKCLGKLGDVAELEGRTVIFVSHNMVAVQSLCPRALLLHEGHLQADESSAPVVARYLKGFRGPNECYSWNNPNTAPGNEVVRIKSVRVVSDTAGGEDRITMQAPFRIETEYWACTGNRLVHLTYHLLNDQGIVVLTSCPPSRVHQIGIHRAVCHVPENLLNSGGYSLRVFVVENENRATYVNECIASFNVVDAAERQSAWMGRQPGVVQPPLVWSTESL